MTGFRLLLMALLVFTSSVVFASDAQILWVAEAKPEENNPVTLDAELRQRLLAQLSHLNIDVMEAHAQRGMYMLQHQPNVCVDDRLATEQRQAFAYISDVPQAIVPGLRLYVGKDSHWSEQWANQHPVSLAEVLANHPAFTLGVLASRRYGDAIDALLSIPQWQGRIWRRSNSYMGKGMLAMLHGGRVDGVVEYPVLVNHFEHAEQLIGIALTEATNYSLGHVMCSRSELGRQVIEQVNQALKRLTQERDYLDTHLQWMESSVHSNVISDYNEVFGTDFRPMPTTEKTTEDG